MAVPTYPTTRPRRSGALATALAAVLLSLGAGLLLAPPAAACSCGMPEPTTELETADAVFIAEPVTSRVLPGDGAPTTEWTMTVREVLAGQADVITLVQTASDEAACGRSLTAEGEAVAVVAYEGDDGALTTGLCSTTDVAALRAAAADLGIEPHEPAGVPTSPTIVAGDSTGGGGPVVIVSAPEDPELDDLEEQVVLVRGLVALLAIALATTMIVAFTSSRDDGA